MAKKIQSKQKDAKSSVTNNPRSVAVKSGVGSPWWMVLLAMAITAICYWPSLKNDLVNWDDDPNIVENVNLAQVGKQQTVRDVLPAIFDLEKGNVIGNYNPLPIATFAVEKAMTGGEFDASFIRQVHLDNLILHLLVVLFSFRVFSLLGMGPLGSFVGALLMGIHPMRVESVAWATERKDVLFAFFYFASLEFYIRYVKDQQASSRTWMFVLSMALAVFSLFSKVQAVTLVVSMLVVDYWLGRKWTMTWIWEKVPLFIASLAMGLANIYTLNVQGSTNDDLTGFNLVDRACVATWSFSVYLYKLFISYPMSPLYPYPKPLPWYIYASPVVFIAVWYGVYRLWKADLKIWVFGFLFFFLNVAPVLQFFGAGQGYLADRFTYVPYFGLFAIIAWYYQQQEQKRVVWNAVLGLFMVAAAYQTVRQIGVWKNGETLWTHVMKYEYDEKTQKYTNALPFWNRGQYRRKQGDYERALSDYTQAVAIDPKNPELFNSRGKTYFDMAAGGKLSPQKASEYLQKALEDYNSAVELSSSKPQTQAEAYVNRGAAYGMSGQYEKALSDLNRGVSINPDNKNAYFNRSIVYFNTGQYDAAIGDYTKYLEFAPYDANILYERGMLRRAMKKPSEAIPDLTRAISIKSDFGLAYLERARANAMLGNKSAAQADYQRAAQFGNNMQEMDRQLMAQ